jgi:sarcosine oxidase
VIRHADVAVVGAGVMGLAAARAAAMAGLSVVVCEQFAVGHARGSSHGTARIFKVAYPDDEFVEMALRAGCLWREIEEESGERILSLSGTLDVGDADRRARALSRRGLEFELLRGSEVERRFGLRGADGVTALFHAEGGVIQADRAVTALLSGARARDVEIAEGTAVVGLVPDGRRVRVMTSTGIDVDAAVAILAAGAWLRQLVEPIGLGLDVQPTRETVAYFRVSGSCDTPTFSEWSPHADGRVTYGLIARDGILKVGMHRAGPPTNPEKEGDVDETTVRREAQWAARHYNLASQVPVRTETCLYTNTVDERFIIERYGRLVIGSACSGHGFKFAPVIGDRLAALACAVAASP